MKIFQKNLLKVLILSISVFFIFQACKKIDLKNPALHEENFVEKFFATKIKLNREVTEIISQLKQENEKTSFINELPANCGLPIWEKLIILQKTNTTQKGIQLTDTPEVSIGNTIIIPLTINNQNLSALRTSVRYAK